MVVQLAEQPKSSLPSDNQPSVSKVPPNEASTSSKCATASTPIPIVHQAEVCPNRVARTFSWTDELGQYLRQIIAYLAAKLRILFCHQEHTVYKDPPLSEVTKRLLESVSRKTLVLDLDETLVHSCYKDPETNDIIGCQLVPQTAVPDYVINIKILSNVQPIEFQVFKRPYVDEFLNYVARWYDLVIYTASLEAYASNVIDKLDAGRGILQRRFYRQHCVSSTALVSKNLHVVNQDLSSILIIDNSPSAYRDFPENAIPIKSYIYDPMDEELLNLLPFLDALRFTKDVRSILSRRVNTQQASC